MKLLFAYCYISLSLLVVSIVSIIRIKRAKSRLHWIWIIAIPLEINGYLSLLSLSSIEKDSYFFILAICNFAMLVYFLAMAIKRVRSDKLENIAWWNSEKNNAKFAIYFSIPVGLYLFLILYHDPIGLSKIGVGVFFRVLLIAPIVEEFTFKYLMPQYFGGMTRVNIMQISLIFTILHLDKGLSGLFGSFIFSVFSFYAYRRTNMLLLPIVFHVVFNIGALL